MQRLTWCPHSVLHHGYHFRAANRFKQQQQQQQAGRTASITLCATWRSWSSKLILPALWPAWWSSPSLSHTRNTTDGLTTRPSGQQHRQHCSAGQKKGRKIERRREGRRDLVPTPPFALPTHPTSNTTQQQTSADNSARPHLFGHPIISLRLRSLSAAWRCSACPQRK